LGERAARAVVGVGGPVDGGAGGVGHGGCCGFAQGRAAAGAVLGVDVGDGDAVRDKIFLSLLTVHEHHASAPSLMGHDYCTRRGPALLQSPSETNAIPPDNRRLVDRWKATSPLRLAPHWPQSERDRGRRRQQMCFRSDFEASRPQAKLRCGC
jgi:hypothetical protein